MDAGIFRDAREVITTLGDVNNRRFDGKRVLLTGAAGFLGTHFVHYFVALNESGLLNAPVQLTAVDNFIRGRPAWMAKLGKASNVELIGADITELSLSGYYDFIIHAASIASPIYYRKYPIETMDANVIGLRRLLDYAAQRPIESMLFLSTSEIYGDPTPDGIPTAETYRGFVSCTGPRASYDESKRFGETLCVNFAAARNVPVKIARPFNNYGPGLKISDRRVLPDFFNQLLSGRPIVMLSDGSPTRTFCYISDAITGYLLILLSAHNGEPFNVGTEEPEISMRTLAELCSSISGSKQGVEFGHSSDADYLTDNPQRRCPDIRKARQMLGYAPKIDLEEGLRRTYQWYLANPAAEDA